MILKSKKQEYKIIRNKFDYPEAHFGYSYEILKNGQLIAENLRKNELDVLRKKHGF